DFSNGVRATREVAQSGLMPSNCRLLDPLEAMLGAGITDGASVLLLAFESADRPVEPALGRAMEICHGFGGVPSKPVKQDDAGDKTAMSWRDTFIKAPYLRDALARLGVVVETFETACTWSAFPSLHEAVVEALAPAIVTCRFTHVYPD